VVTAPHDANTPDGALWFTGLNNVCQFSAAAIGWITTRGKITVYRNGLHNMPAKGIAVGPDGAPWFSDGGPWIGGSPPASGMLRQR